MTDVTISQAELDELRGKAARTDDAEKAAEKAGAGGAAGEYLVPHRALLADGTVCDYEGAHPTHVSKTDDDGREVLVPVMTVYPTA